MRTSMRDDVILSIKPLGFPWETFDPFLFCVHHDDAYPEGNGRMGPRASLAGRAIGQDFEGKNGWRMYHGEKTPGFPQHPHRGFETVTIARRGFIDHSDSLGATARFGTGDVQWLTAGGGIVHSEMFPLLRDDAPNPVELFQIWLNLPRADKMAEPHFSMLWSEHIPRPVFVDESGRKTTVTVVAGRLGDATPPSPPPRSWASHDDADVAIWTLHMEPGARFTLPAAKPGSNRLLGFFRGKEMRIADRAVRAQSGVRVKADVDVTLVAGDEPCELLLLQGRPIGERVVQYGPFVMTTPEEIQRAFLDYRRTGFGGWPWPDDEPVHPKDAGRFARHADGHTEKGGAKGGEKGGAA
jgi:hypothetical protein